VTDFVHQAIGTALLRPYFVAFLLTYFLACSLHLGVKRAILFAVAGYLLAWAAEYSSIHTGVPFGPYYYIETTRNDELWVKGVPFMDSMSFVFLAYAAYSMALMVVSPFVRGRGIYVLETRRIRRSLGTTLLGTLFFVYLDIIIDPVSLQGSKWFLGQIYGYPGGGAYFGVPIWNFLGWFVVGFLLILVLQSIDRLLARAGTNDAFGKTWARRHMLGPALYVSIILFNLSVAFAIGEYNILWAGIFIVSLPFSLIVSLLSRPLTGASLEDAIRAHLQDFPGVHVPVKAGVLRRGRMGKAFEDQPRYSI
jgi:putative membrane protein